MFENNESFDISIDMEFYQKCKDEFIEELEKILGIKVNPLKIKSKFNKDGKFKLFYSKFDYDDQVGITKLCYPNSSMDLIIELNSRTYKNVVVRKEVKKTLKNNRS